MKTIQLSQGLDAIVDDADYEYLRQWRWSASEKRKGHGEFYAIRCDKETKRMVLMHRQIMAPNVGEHIDHINGNPLDNRRENLRVCTHSQNMMNKRKHHRKSSQYKGVYWHKGAGKWMASVGRENRYLGLFTSEKDAAAAYDKAAAERYGEFARLNLTSDGGSDV